MSDIRFKPFNKQKDFFNSIKRTKGGFAGKRGGKTEIGAIQSIHYQETKPNYKPNGVDPYLGVIMAPTHDMLKRLSWKKFMAYAGPFIASYTKSPLEIKWDDGSEVIGVSADKPERLEGVKANWIWLDEVFQLSEQVYLEAKARVADSQGYITCTGSLGVQYRNPKKHWAYKYFKEDIDEDTACFEWRTIDNPYFPKDEIEKLRNTLDPETFRQMFELNWDTAPTNSVYEDFSDANIIDNYNYDHELETYVAIDWGWAHPMACLFIQYDAYKDFVYVFDEIFGSKITLDELYKRMMKRTYRIDGFICDIAGSQEREQLGKSNISWFKEKGIHFQKRATKIAKGIPIVRSYIKNGRGVRKLYISKNCPNTIDGVKMYRYPEKDGVVTNENPLKENDDCVDALRYFFVNKLDPFRSNDKAFNQFKII